MFFWVWLWVGEGEGEGEIPRADEGDLGGREGASYMLFPRAYE